MNSTWSARAFLVTSSVVYMVLIWFVSGISRTGGFFIFAAGAAGLALCLWGLRKGRRQPLFILYLATAMLSAGVGGAEAVFWLAPGVLKHSIANHAYGGYHFLPGGIYARDRWLGHALRPGQSRRIFWNGHWWHHEVNAAGYRGPLLSRADAVFLGDSMIYGHGVDNHATAASQFAAHTSWTTANLGQQGTCLVQMCHRYRNLGEPLQPRIVFVCSHPNDIDEAASWYPADELKRFLAATPDQPYQPLAHPFYWPAPWWRVDHAWRDALSPALRLGGALAGWRRSRGTQTPAPSLSDECMIPSPEAMAASFAPWTSDSPAARQLGWRIHCHALAQLKHDCERTGTRLVVLDIGFPAAFSNAIEELALQLNLPYSPAGRVALERALAGEPVYLANDGHWTPHGNALIAAELARRVESGGR